eukprot:365239-Chlamydomonas_euryale.AAC.4
MACARQRASAHTYAMGAAVAAAAGVSMAGRFHTDGTICFTCPEFCPSDVTVHPAEGALFTVHHSEQP